MESGALIKRGFLSQLRNEPNKYYLNAQADKYSVPPSEMDMEKFIRSITPQKSKKKKHIKRFLNEEREDAIKNGKQGKQFAIEIWETNLLKQEISEEIDKEFAIDFYYWLQGKGQALDHQRTPWGYHPIRDEEVLDYISLFLEAKIDFQQKLFKLSKAHELGTLRGINEYYLFFKYIVRGDSANLDDASFLEDYELFWTPVPTKLKTGRNLDVDGPVILDQLRGKDTDYKNAFNEWYKANRPNHDSNEKIKMEKISKKVMGKEKEYENETTKIEEGETISEKAKDFEKIVKEREIKEKEEKEKKERKEKKRKEKEEKEKEERERKEKRAKEIQLLTEQAIAHNIKAAEQRKEREQKKAEAQKDLSEFLEEIKKGETPKTPEEAKKEQLAAIQKTLLAHKTKSAIDIQKGTEKTLTPEEKQQQIAAIQKTLQAHQAKKVSDIQKGSITPKSKPEEKKAQQQQFAEMEGFTPGLGPTEIEKLKKDEQQKKEAKEKERADFEKLKEEIDIKKRKAKEEENERLLRESEAAKKMAEFEEPEGREESPEEAGTEPRVTTQQVPEKDKEKLTKDVEKLKEVVATTQQNIQQQVQTAVQAAVQNVVQQIQPPVTQQPVPIQPTVPVQQPVAPIQQPVPIQPPIQPPTAPIQQQLPPLPSVKAKEVVMSEPLSTQKQDVVMTPPPIQPKPTEPRTPTKEKMVDNFNEAEETANDIHFLRAQLQQGNLDATLEKEIREKLADMYEDWFIVFNRGMDIAEALGGKIVYKPPPIQETKPPQQPAPEIVMGETSKKLTPAERRLSQRQREPTYQEMTVQRRGKVAQTSQKLRTEEVQKRRGQTPIEYIDIEKS